MNDGTMIVVVVGIVAVFMLKALRIIMHRPRQERFNEEDAQIIQRLDAGLAQMERRIEALETILTESSLRR